MTTTDRDLHACILAALILHDGDVTITGEKMKTILDASNNSDVQLVYCNIVAKFLEGKDIPALLTDMAISGSKGKDKEAEWDMLSDTSHGWAGDSDVDCIDCGCSDDEAFCSLFD